ncbi:MAG: SBBP repeat-containing protein [Candidatus Brocadiaceae bacterium]|nr:SBBP repeat-containing protein [Candidatus Brocadiaceae bacterium]
MASGAFLSYSTYLGGGSVDRGYGIAVDSDGNAYVTGSTGSSDFPTVNAIDESYNGSKDVFVTKITHDPLMAHYEFNEGSGKAATDSTGNGNNGAICGATWSAGRGDSAGLDFDGVDDAVKFTTHLGITGELTVSAWVYPTAAPMDTGRVIASTFAWDCNAANKRGWTLGIPWGSRDRLLFQVFDGSGNSARAHFRDFFINNLNQWTHVVGVFKPSTYIRLYVNGVMVSEDTTHVPSAIAYQAGTNLSIGARADSNAGRWQGGIDEVRIYGQALSDQEILDLYNGL